MFDLKPLPAAILVDLEGTLVEFGPTVDAVIRAVSSFDSAVSESGIDVDKVHYVSNLNFRVPVGLPGFERIHVKANKPFFIPPKLFLDHGPKTFVIGDQYLTDGLLAWRFGFSFALTGRCGREPLWPRVQRSAGRCLCPLFFCESKNSR